MASLSIRGPAAALALACALLPATRAQDLREFSTQGRPGSEGLVVRVRHPSHWKQAPVEDDLAIAELRGREGGVTAILQIGRGRRRADTPALCAPERAPAMLRNVEAREPGTRVTEVVARTQAGRPAFDIRYERKADASFLRVHSVIVCLRDTRLLVSCGASGEARAALAGVDAVCDRVLQSLAIAEEPAAVSSSAPPDPGTSRP